MISIIIPCSEEYRIKFLPECLESVNPQLGNNELIIAPFEPKKDGFSNILNKAVRGCKGEFVLVLGADDKLGEGCIKKLEESLGEEDVYYGNIEEFGDVNRVHIPPAKVSFRLFLKANQIAITSLFRKSKYMEVGGYWENNQCPEDWELWARMAKHKAKFKYVNITILKYRVHGAQAWATMQFKVKEYKKVINDRLGFNLLKFLSGKRNNGHL
jgi:glycosyltransferase involved in cell wall biosynthesis